MDFNEKTHLKKEHKILLKFRGRMNRQLLERTPAASLLLLLINMVSFVFLALLLMEIGECPKHFLRSPFNYLCSWVRRAHKMAKKVKHFKI